MRKGKASGIWGKLKAGGLNSLLAGRGVPGQIEDTIGIGDFLDHTASIAVLPFTDDSAKANQAHFCEGMAEEILNTLAGVSGLRVVSRKTSFQCREGQHDAVLAARRLGVDSLLTGRLQKTGNDLRLTAQLLYAQNGREAWSRQYERTIDAAVTTQLLVAESVTRTLGLTAPGQERQAEQAVDPRAYDLFLRGLSYFARHTTQDIVHARQMLKQAIEIEPGYGRAWAGVAYTHGFEYMYFNASDVNLAEVQRTSAKALELAPKLAQSHVAAGIASCMNHDHGRSEREFSAAIELDPCNYQAWYFFGRAKVQEGDLERALKLFDCASRVRPEDYQSVLLQAQLYISQGRNDKAIEVTQEGIKRARTALAINPGDNRALNLGAFALLRLGEPVEAGKWMTKSLENAPMDSIIQYNGACFHSLAGEVEQALDCLENCLIKVGNINRDWLVHDSDLDNIRDHPRYSEIVSSFPGK